MEEVQTDMKQFDTKELADIKVIHDKANRALTDARYWRSHANPTKLQEAESRYKQFSFELVEMINRLVYNKESQFPEYLRRLGQAQLSFFENSVVAARHYMQKLAESMFICLLITYQCSKLCLSWTCSCYCRCSTFSRF